MAELLPPLIVSLQATITDFTAKMATAKAEMDTVAAKGASTADSLAAAGRVGFTAFGVAAAAIGTISLVAAGQFEDAHARLVTALKNTGSSFDALAPQVKAAEANFTALGFSNTQYESTLARMTMSLGSSTKALADMNTVADVARAFGKGLEETTVLIAKAAEGNAMSLKRLGIDIELTGTKSEKAAQLMKLLNDRFGGTAAAEAETFNGQIRNLHAEMTNLFTTIGESLIPVVERLAGMVGAAARFFKDHSDAAYALAGAIAGPLVGAMVVFVAQQAIAFGTSVVNAVVSLGGLILSTLVPSIEAATVAEGGLADMTALATGGLSLVGGLAAVAAAHLFLHAQGASDAAAANQDLVNKNKDLAASYGEVSDAAAKTLKTVDDMIGVMERAASATESFAAAKRRLKEDTGKLHEDEKKLADLIAKGPVDLEKVANATDVLTAARDRAKKATEEQTKAQQKLDELLKPQDQDKVASAEDKVGAATDGVTRANLALIDAQKRLNDLLHPEATDAYSKALGVLHEAQSRLLLANAVGNQAEIAKATKDVADAQKSLNDVTKPATEEDITKARLDVDDATRTVHQSTRDLTQANKDLADTNRPTVGTEKEIADQRQIVADKTDAVAAATRGVTHSQEDLADALKGDPAFMGQVAAARHTVATDTQAIADAQDHITSTGLAMKIAVDKATADIQAQPELFAQAKRALEDYAKANPEIVSPLLKAMLGMAKLPPMVVTLDMTTMGLGSGRGAAHPDLGPTSTAPDLGPSTMGGTVGEILTTVFGNTIGGAINKAVSLSWIWGGKQGGGPVSGGRPYMVGEGGPELFIPGQSGTVIPSGGGGGVTVGEIHVHAGPGMNERELAALVREELLRLDRRSISVGLS